ncbi:PLP-dependent aminotransferase family protein [uncultured Dubosiella sp.]|uniref:aminotransferase-like domain-containing protein n=1 Tax=uncultured Dubosiella sp. TaxID=1937011 RepID=UPI0027311B14|nr:PLP-dependent aminotransferase family protein [uncultured Dubosiella sp.]
MKKYKTVYDHYRNAILDGYLKKGDALPSIRKACDQFQCSQTTIEHAYEQLVLDGYIEAIEKVGYRVRLEEAQIKLHREMEAAPDKAKEDLYDLDFRPRSVAIQTSDVQTWKRYIRQTFENEVMNTYGDPQGEFVLRQALSLYAYKNRGVMCRTEQVLVGPNYQTLLFVLCGMFDVPGVVGMEKPFHPQAHRVFESYGWEVREVELVDDADLSEIDMLYVNSSSTGPKKEPLSASLRDYLLEQADLHDFLIIEDDYNGELTYRSRSRRAMYGSDTNDRVIYCGSFSRLLLPSVRISYLVLNEMWTQYYLSHKTEYGPMASKLEQLAFASYIADGHLERHVRKLKRDYREKSLRMEQALAQHGFSFFLNEAYLSYVVQVDADPRKLSEEAEKADIGLLPMENGTVELSFASIEQENIATAVSRFANLVRLSKNEL